MPRKNPGPPCAICGKPSEAHNLCHTHYQRWRRHGHVENTRPDDWGQRSKHPLWECWKGTYRLGGRVEEWEDFWKFVEDVGERPGSKYYLRRLRDKEPWGPNNWYWRAPSGESYESKKKRAKAMREYRKRQPQRVKNTYLKKMFGITIQDYDEMLESQNGGCKICGGKDKSFRLAVDHCHGTGKIRGLLCSKCNRGIGCFKDSTDLLRKAIEYLS